MMHPTLKQFMKTIEVMRKTYPFKDEETRIVSTYDPRTGICTLIDLVTDDKETGVEVRLTKEIEVDDGEQY